MTKLIYKPLGWVAGVPGGLIASFIFRRLWTLIGRRGQVPRATEEGRTWGEVLTAAALQGAIFGLVRAAVDRGGAVGIQRATGSGPVTSRPATVKGIEIELV
jgi:hypothetical protein